MFSFITNYFTGQKLNKNIVQPYIYSISKKSNFEELGPIFENLLPNIPLDNYYSIDIYNELFAEFDYEQINIFSNNLCKFIEEKMKDKLGLLNYCTELLLNFTVTIFVKFNTVRELITKSYNNILDKNNDIILTISKSFLQSGTKFLLNMSLLVHEPNTAKFTFSTILLSSHFYTI